jgi:undecaprenyl diphosphate synthase
MVDGNGRWATQRGMPRMAGHRATVQHFLPVVEAALDLGIRIFTVYMFSTENWQRPADEVAGVLRVVQEAIPPTSAALHQRGVQIRHLGSTERLDPALRQAIHEATDLTRDNRRLIFNFAFNYGRRADVVRAVRTLAARGIAAEQIDERAIGAALSTHGQPDPDLVIRTGGELRLSNCLLWQVAYSELYFSPKLTPDFTGDDLREAVAAFRSRQRTYGRLVHS